MRFLLLSLCLAACSTDTFTGDDGGGGGDASPSDGNAPVDATPSEGGKADAAPFDPGSLGASLLLWLDANDATTVDAGDTVLAWPDHQNKYTTVINLSGGTGCSVPGLHVMKEGKINHSVVTFCSANLAVKDTAALHMGTSEFFITAVIAPGPSTGNTEVLFTKTLAGDSSPAPTNLTLVAPSASNRFQGWLDGTGLASSQNTLSQEFQNITFVRNATEITARVNGSAGTQFAVTSSDNVSNDGAEIGIGGYRFDIGNVQKVFHGEIVELAVVTNMQALGPLELYLTKKYGL